MKKIFITLLLLAAITQLNAQIYFTDTLYLNEAKSQTSKQEANYIRIITNDTSGLIRFEVKDFNLQHQLVYHGYYNSLGENVKTGTHSEFYPNGTLKSSKQYTNNQLQGITAYFDKQGNLVKKTTYDKGKLNGAFITYYPNGIVKRNDNYIDNKFSSGNCYTSTGTDTSYYPYLVTPTYKGGWTQLNTYLLNELRTTDNFKMLTEKSTALLKVTISNTGTVESIRIISGSRNNIMQEAIKLIKMSSDWIPGLIDGKPGNISINLPLEFVPE